MDRFKLPDEPEEIVLCAECYEWIYVGDRVVMGADGELVHDAYGCKDEYAIRKFYELEGTINDRGGIE